jgi:hypothetical protein
MRPTTLLAFSTRRKQRFNTALARSTFNLPLQLTSSIGKCKTLIPFLKPAIGQSKDL